MSGERVGPEVDVGYIDPDPATILLSVLSALGSVASISAYLHWLSERGHSHRNREGRDRGRETRELSELVLALETLHIEVAGGLHAVEVLLSGSEDGRGARQLSEAHFAFGEFTALYGRIGYDRLDELFQEIIQKCAKMNDLSARIMRRLYDKPVEPGGFLVQKMLEHRDMMNQALHAGMTYEHLFVQLYEVAQRGRDICRDLREIALR